MLLVSVGVRDYLGFFDCGIEPCRERQGHRFLCRYVQSEDILFGPPLGKHLFAQRFKFDCGVSLMASDFFPKCVRAPNLVLANNRFEASDGNRIDAKVRIALLNSISHLVKSPEMKADAAR